MASYLFSATIPSVAKIITSSRRTEDLWAGSVIISYLIKKAIKAVRESYQMGVTFIFPDVEERKLDDFKFADVTNKILLKLENFSSEDVTAFAKKLEECIYSNLEDLCVFGMNKIGIKDESYLDIARYQAKDTIRFFWSAIELTDGYEEKKKTIDRYLSYIKNAELRQDGKYQAYGLIEPRAIEGSYDEFVKTADFKSYCRGAYACSMCMENTIIGASLQDFMAKEFWQGLWKTDKKIKRGERLCGFCIMKRYLREKLDISGFPSTSEIAATDFKLRLLKDNKAIEQIADIFAIVKDVLPEGNRVAKLNENIKGVAHKWVFELDGSWMMVDTWENPNDYEELEIDANKSRDIADKLERLYREIGYAPTPMYALISIDGDNMGAKISELNEQGHRKLSEKQSKFIDIVRDIVTDSYGSAIYIGGDDVLAILPVNWAVDCAKRINEAFIGHMKEIRELLPLDEQKYDFTLSGALVLAHHLLPFQYVLGELFGLLKRVKKSGKNSVGIKFIKHSLATDEVILGWNGLDDIAEMPDIPHSFIYQIGDVSRVVSSESFDNRDIKKAIIRSLLKRKQTTDEIDNTIQSLSKFYNNLSFSDINSLLKVRRTLYGK